MGIHVYLFIKVRRGYMYPPPLLYHSRFGENIDDTSSFGSSEINALVQKRPNPQKNKLQDHTSQGKKLEGKR